MRMVHYFGALALACVPALCATAVAGILAHPSHLMIGLSTGVLVVLTHTLLILFMIVTGRILREAMRARPLGGEFLERLNEFFARKSAYPAAILAAFLTVATGVLGYTYVGFGVSPIVHLAFGLLTLVVNFWALGIEFRALRRNQELIDDVALELDRLDRESPPESPDDEDEYDPRKLERAGLIVAISAWMPYAYWGAIEHRFDFARTSVHPWIEVSALGLVLWWLARREAHPASPEPSPDAPTGEATGSTTRRPAR